MNRLLPLLALTPLACGDPDPANPGSGTSMGGSSMAGSGGGDCSSAPHRI